MTLDEALTQWKDATDRLTPSDALMAKLSAAVDSAPPEQPTAEAPPAAAASGVATGIKVLLVVVVGTVGWALFSPVNPLHSSWFARSTTQDQVERETACPARLTGGAPAPVEANAISPVPAVGVAWVGPSRDLPLTSEVVTRAQHQLQSRPMDCAGQLAPIDVMLFHGGVTGAERGRLLARKAYLCGVSPEAMSVQVPLVRDSPSGASGGTSETAWKACDDTDWCHVPTCSEGARGLDAVALRGRPGGVQEARECMRKVARRPARSCGGMHARLGLIGALCMLEGRGGTVDLTEVRRYSNELRAEYPPHQVPEPWCLEAGVHDEVGRLKQLGIRPGSLSLPASHDGH